MPLSKTLTREEYNAFQRERYAAQVAKKAESERAKQAAARLEMAKQAVVNRGGPRRYLQEFGSWLPRVPDSHERERLAWSLQVIGGGIGVSRRHELIGDGE
jgi:hypothetical protein